MGVVVALCSIAYEARYLEIAKEKTLFKTEPKEGRVLNKLAAGGAPVEGQGSRAQA